MQADLKDIAAGLLLVAAALFFGLIGFVQLPLGTSFRMGPGYFPALLSGLLAVMGLIIAGRAIGRSSEISTIRVPWRGVLLTSAATVAFALLVPAYGLVPALVTAILLSAFASRRMTWPLAVGLATGLTLFSALLFRYGLGVPVPLLGAS
ncbi:tripartite tricarboxylate transporter TctB family protein [Bosea sp. AS-1]|uniref:tripartite tricarboxylate transporter TctB family protein n=1 Tax=Bosea sp. AS-1 TaxID=2015316 RepID=UPI000B787FCB|nr:tripartite tricarboxylate transporter TctB family protein [Bosea sp. AS-1]